MENLPQQSISQTPIQPPPSVGQPQMTEPQDISKKPGKKKLLIYLSLFALLCLFIGLGYAAYSFLGKSGKYSSQVKTTKDSQQLPIEPTKPTPTPTLLAKVNFAISKGDTNEFLIKIIKEQEFDKKNGINIESRYFPMGKTIPALTEGLVDIDILNPIKAASLSLEGHDIKIFAPFALANCPFLTSKDSSVESLKDLEGKTIGLVIYPKINLIDDSMIKTILKTKNLRMGEFFQIRKGPPTSILPQFQTNQLTIITGLCRETDLGKVTAADQKKAVLSLNELLDFKTPIISYGLAAKSDWLDSHLAQAQALVKTYQEVFDFIKTNRDIFANFVIDKEANIKIETSQEIDAVVDFAQKIYPEKTYWNQEAIDALDDFLKEASRAGVLERVPSGRIFVKI